MKKLWFIHLEEDDTDELNEVSSESDLIPTSEAIKNIELFLKKLILETG